MLEAMFSGIFHPGFLCGFISPPDWLKKYLRFIAR